ncbi:MAG: methyltransferase domain-containing protein [Myxococcota bacterium]
METKPSLDVDALERLVPDAVREKDATGTESLRLSVERYEFAANHIEGGRVLDIACGSGYGTRLMADRGEPLGRVVTGVDLSEAAIEYATGRYGNENTRFVAGDGMDFGDGDGFDAVVSIETIEHVPDARGFIERLFSLVRPGGLLIASVPVTPSVDGNPHHLHDFNPRSFRRPFLERGMLELDSLEQVQPFGLFSVLSRSEARMKDVRPNLVGYYLGNPRAFARRCWSTVRHGLVNKYLTIAWRAP